MSDPFGAAQNILSKKSLMIELFLCKARRQIRSIVNLCEHFSVRRSRAKFTNQNDFLQFGAEAKIPRIAQAWHDILVRVENGIDGSHPKIDIG